MDNFVQQNIDPEGGTSRSMLDDLLYDSQLQIYIEKQI